MGHPWKGWKDKPHECLRCPEPHAPGSKLCHDHLRLIAELAEERRRNLELVEVDDDG